MTTNRTILLAPPDDASSLNDPQRRQRSTIDFPYLSLEIAEEVAAAVYERCGHSLCEIDELAAQLKQNISGAFRQKVAAARTFGLVAREGRGTFALTDVGKKIVVDETAAEGRIEAFLSVPLYAAIFERYRGHALPPSRALERDMESLGVATKQTDKARQAFERSAQYSGFFDAGRDRLVRPRAELIEQPQEGNERQKVEGTDDNASEGVTPSVDPIIQGLLARLPKTGAIWPENERKLWLALLEGSFKLIYEDNNPADKAANE